MVVISWVDDDNVVTEIGKIFPSCVNLEVGMREASLQRIRNSRKPMTIDSTKNTKMGIITKQASECCMTRQQDSGILPNKLQTPFCTKPDCPKACTSSIDASSILSCLLHEPIRARIDHVIRNVRLITKTTV